MIVLKNRREIELMREAGRISAGALKAAGEAVEPGISTEKIDRIAYHYIKSQGAEPNFLHYNGFPATACISVNNEVIHGIPDKKHILREGDIVSIDLGAVINGFHLSKKTDYSAEELREIRSLAEQLARYDCVFYTCHCTGETAFDEMKKILGEKLVYVHSGDEVIL